MILKKLKMRNFRQFHGNQEIIFASQDQANGKNITVIFGENGRGKTGIYRAVMFCLYGDHRLSQDSHIEEKELHLVNIFELQNYAANNRKNVEGFVEIEFSHKGLNYNLKRSIFGMLEDEEIFEELGSVCLHRQDGDGNTITCEDISEISQIINSILDQSVREYFLFDGEKIEKLTRASSEQRKEISRGLRNLLNIDTLEKAKKSTARLQKTLDAQLEKKSVGDYAKILNKIKNNLEEKTKLEEKLKYFEKDIELAVEEKRKTDKEFEQIKEVIGLLKEREQLENQEREYEEQLKNLLADLKNKSGKLSQVMMANTVNNVFDYINQQKQKGQLPSEIRKDLIDRILSEGKCICGREINSDSDSFEKIIEWRNRSNEVVIEDFMLELWRLLSSVSNHFDDVVMNSQTLLQKYAVTKNDIEKIRINIKEIGEKIGSSVRTDAPKLEKIRKNIETKLIKLEAERTTIINELKISKEEYEQLLVKRKEKEREEGIRDELSQRATLASETHQALSSIYDEFTSEIKDIISKSATEYFKKFIDSQGRDTLSRIVVNDDYSIQILDKWNKPFLANISAGQRQIMSISFIAALAKAASKDDIFEMPFFMDSPFGRLSNEHRKNLINNVSNFSNQWILLATDTEFRKFEARLFKQTEHWGQFYVLKGEGPGVTKIEQHSIDDAFTYLKN